MQGREEVEGAREGWWSGWREEVEGAREGVEGGGRRCEAGEPVGLTLKTTRTVKIVPL